MLTTGRRVDRYVVEGKLGEGAMAVVYRVRHETLGTAHALKVLSIGPGDVRDRLVREGGLQARLQNENVVEVTDVLTVDGHPGLLMEFVEGPTLEQWLTRYRPTVDEAASLFRGICAGVGYAHTKGVIHCDLKPANVLLALSHDRMTPRVVDFGLATELERPMPGNTRLGATKVTPGYMAPEQIGSAGAVDHRADLWSLGCILYRLVCGVAPFEGDDLGELYKQIASADYVSSRRLRPDITDRVHLTIERLLEVDVEERLGDCGVLIDWMDGRMNHLPSAMPNPPQYPSTKLPRSIPLESEAADVARGIVAETLSHLPKLERGPTASPWHEPEPVRQPIAPQAGGDSIYEPPPKRRGRGILVALSLAGAVAVAAVLVTIGGVGLYAIVRAGAPIAESPATEVAPEPEAAAAGPLAIPVEIAPVAEPRPARESRGSTQPKPRPEAASAEPESEPEPVSGAATGTVTFAGADRLWLQAWNSTTELRDLDAVPPGRYRIFAVFPNSAEASGAGEVTIRAGQAVHLVCVPDFARCKQP